MSKHEWLPLFVSQPHTFTAIASERLVPGDAVSYNPDNDRIILSDRQKAKERANADKNIIARARIRA